MPNVLVPAWYLRNGRINAAENTLENASSSCERWGIFCAALVVISVIAELVIAFIEPPYNIFLKLSAPTDAAVAIGIVGEVLFGMWDGRIQTELRKRSNRWVEEATERAARLEKEAADARARVAEIEQITAWRHVPEEKREEIAEKLRAIGPSIRLFFEYQNGDIEAFSYLNEIALTFVEAKVGGRLIPLTQVNQSLAWADGARTLVEPVSEGLSGRGELRRVPCGAAMA